MKKALSLLALLFFYVCVSAQTFDFIRGGQVIFEDDFSLAKRGDFPAKWNTSGEGQIVGLDGVPGKWLKIKQPTAISPKLKKALPENCTIEFDLYLKNTTGVAPVIMFGLTPLSNVSAGDVYRSHISMKLFHYNEAGSVVYEKNIQELGEKKFPLEGFIDRVLHVSIAVDKTRFRIYLGDEKVVDLPKILTPDYRKNFFIASSVIMPDPEEGVYISNIIIAAVAADKASPMIKKLME